MTKRFTTNGYKIYDTFHDGIHWLVNQVEANEIVDKMNNLDSKARERSKALSKLQKENEQLKQELERCKYWLNSDKYDYQLTLAFIKNKGYSLKDVLEYEKELKE